MSQQKDAFVFGLGFDDAAEPVGFQMPAVVEVAFSADINVKSYAWLNILVDPGTGGALATDQLDAAAIDFDTRLALDTISIQYIADRDEEEFVVVDRLPLVDNLLSTFPQVPGAASFTYLYTGPANDAFDRASAASAENIATTDNLRGVAIVTKPGNWSVASTPAVNNQATATQAAPAAGHRHVCTSITATLSTNTADQSITGIVNLRAGTTGAGTVLWSTRLTIDTHVATIGGVPIAGIALSGLSIPGADATAMTLEFAANGGAAIFESVALTGYTAGPNG